MFFFQIVLKMKSEEKIVHTSIKYIWVKTEGAEYKCAGMLC